MRSTESQQRQQSDRRQLILDTTLRLIAAGGIDSVTHRKVADAAGIPLGSTTYYFDSREHLLGEAFEYYITMAMALHESLISGPINSSHELVDFLVELTERELDDEPLLLAEYEMTLFAARNERIAGLLHEWDSVMIANIVAALTGLGATRSLEPTHSRPRGFSASNSERGGGVHPMSASAYAFVPRECFLPNRGAPYAHT
jgi:DNA-binding transcriptional regulator YbjK